MSNTERFRRLAGHDASPSAVRAAKREWKSALDLVNVLLRRTDAARVPIVCLDGTTVFILRGSPDGVRETVTVRLQGPDPLADSWDAPSPAPGMYRNVSAADVVELVWAHGGVDMAASRAMQEAEHADHERRQGPDLHGKSARGGK